MAARVGIAASLLLHGAVVALLLWVPPLPALDFELELPVEVEFGVAQPAAPEPPAETTAITPESPADVPSESEAPGAKPPELGDTPVEPEPKPPRPKPPAVPAGPLLAAYAPKGTQLNLRVDLELVRACR
jgi:outer membrane biosynthesis protein TonB